MPALNISAGGDGVRVLVDCEYSGTVRNAFAAQGWDAWSCDLLPTEQPGQHFMGPVEAMAQQWGQQAPMVQGSLAMTDYQ